MSVSPAARRRAARPPTPRGPRARPRRRTWRAIAAGFLICLASLAPLRSFAQAPAPQPAGYGSAVPQSAQAAPAPASRPGSPGISPDIGGDRPRGYPDALRPDSVAPNSGVEVGVGGPFVSIESSRLNFSQGPQRFMSDGALLSADIVLDQWRFEYAKLLLRRALEAGTTYNNTPVNFVGVDADQFWAFYGWWPLYNLYLGAGLGYEYRLTRLSNSGSSVKAFTDSLALRGVVANWAVAPPITLRFRAYEEDRGGIVHISGTALQIGYIVPF